MTASEKYIDIVNRQADYKFINDETWRTEAGLRAIAFMYDDHSNDKNSHDNIILLKDNIEYRLFSATHQYLLFLKEMSASEAHLQKLFQKNPSYVNAFPFGNPYFEKVELELSSLFDNIIFQVSSIFDYLSHIICYILFTNKSNTFYWTKLAKASRGQNQEFTNVELKNIIDNIDRRFVGRLYDYRSRLLHNKRDRHQFGGTTTLGEFRFTLQLIPSNLALKQFKLIADDIPSDKIVTLTYLASWILKRTFKEIEEILDGLAIEIKKDSNFHKNLYHPKKGDNAVVVVSFNQDTKFLEPASDKMWQEYKNKKAGS